MCGICGVVSVEQTQPLSEERLVAMRDSLIHRGPDDAGHYLGPGAALGSRRLAVLDLSQKGHMPMVSSDGRYQIVYNGEVYNFESLRADMEKKGIRFHSGTDTEVILNLYIAEGPSMLTRLNGMFAIAVWDSQDRRLFLARDRLGVKPLYYSGQNGRFYFASEEKAFFAAGLPASFDSSTLEELLVFHYTAGEKTPYAGVKRLLPGHYLDWHQGKASVVRWWNLAERARRVREEVTRDPETWFRATFDDAVRIRRISDVPVGVFLSGGLDSGSVAASMAMQNNGPVSGFTIRFEEKEYDEGPLAAAVASRYKLNVHELKIPLAEAAELLGQAAGFLDEPMAHASDIHLWMISRYAKRKATVLLSGEGADETMAGYGWYLKYRILPLLKNFRFPAAVLQAFSPRLRKLNRFLSLNPVSQMILRESSETMPKDLAHFGISPVQEHFEFREALLREARELYPGEPVRQAMYYDQHTYLSSILDRNDKMTMAASIECRTPFLDYRLVEGLASMPSSLLFKGWKNKSLLRRALGDRLPSAVLRGRKKGFDVPWPLYMRQNAALKKQVLELPGHPVLASLTLDRRKMEQGIKAFLAGDDTHARLVRHLLMLAVWYDACIAQRSAKS